MFLGFFIIFIPLIIGYLIPLHHTTVIKLVNHILNWIIHIILFFMGMNLASLDNLSTNLIIILHYSIVNIIVILLCNAIALLLLEYIIPWVNFHKKDNSSRISIILELLRLCGVVVLGFLFGINKPFFLQYIKVISEYTLIFLLFLIGMQLRNNGMTLMQIIFNSRGLTVAAVVVVSSLIGGIINAFLLNIPLNAALAMASGFGWYSLSSILLTESFGPVIGHAAFFNDLGRELIAIVLIPNIIKYSCSVALGLCGATSMDFTLPVLQRSGGMDVVPAAIVHGFILSLLVPILIAFFSK